MTDITELAQREKFEAWFEGAEALPWGYLKNRRTSDSAYQDPDITDMWVAWKAAGAELVEALEKSDSRLHEVAVACATAEQALEKAQQRIDELENDEVRQRLANAEHQLYMAELAKHNLRASRKAQFRKRKAAEKRIAELEARTVKLPELCVGVVQGGHAVMVPYPAGHWFNKTAILEMLAAAGIKWEGE